MMIIIFVGGLCLLTGVYGLISGGYAPILVGATVWGSLLIGYEIGKA